MHSMSDKSDWQLLNLKKLAIVSHKALILALVESKVLADVCSIYVEVDWQYLQMY